MSDYGDLDDLQARLGAVEADTTQKIVPVIGSGLSNGVIPDVRGMTEIFGRAMPKGSEQKFHDTIDPILGTTLGYQNAASLLKRRAGDHAIAKAIRIAVLRTAASMSENESVKLGISPSECELLLGESERWSVPDGYRGLARLYRRLDGSQRGPIITTNFDPLIEVAFRDEGIDAYPVSVPFDVVPMREHLEAQTGIPVVHIHGYWTNSLTLNTIAQLTRPRPHLEAFLRETIRNSVTLVVGYGGWDDAFMTNLAARIREANLLNSEILWSSYSSEPERALENEVLRALDGAPAFSLYVGVDGNKLFQPEPVPATLPQVAPFGYTGLPLNNAPSKYDPSQFVEGREPGWADALTNQWPLLQPTRSLLQAAEDAIAQGGGAAVVAIGPMGEGKSLALRQVAVTLAHDHTDWSVLWREPGAPRITAQWFEELKHREDHVILCIDEADLVLQDLLNTRDVWAHPGSGILLTLATHDRLWRTSGGAALASVAHQVQFQGLETSDAVAVVDAWEAHGLLASQTPDGQQNLRDATVEQLRASSRALVEGTHTTLFGAVLDVRHGRDLSRRIGDLLERLYQVKIRDDSDINLGQVFGGICLLQDLYDRYGSQGRGATRAIIAAMVSLNGVFADGKILSLLGREAAIAFSGDRVYSRHPAIARAVIEELRAQDKLDRVAWLVGHAGGRLRDQGGLSEGDYRDAYFLTRELSVASEILEAAKGAAAGAPELLEPRVTLASRWRKIDQDATWDYLNRVAPTIGDKRDYGAAVRAFLNEYALSAHAQGETQFGVGLLALSLADGTGFALDQRRAEYGLANLARLGIAMYSQNRELVSEMLSLAIEIFDRVAGRHERTQFLGGRSDKFVDVQLAASTSKVLCDKLEMKVKNVAASAIRTSGLVWFEGTDVRLVELARLAA